MQIVIDDTPIPDGSGILHHSEGVDLLPANIELSGMEIRLINAMSRESVLRTYIHAVKPHYDYNPIDADADCIYLERDICSRLNRYAADETITDVWVWYEAVGANSYLIYIGYA